MGYDIAIKKAWEDLAKLKPENNLSVKFLADEYNLDLEARRILSLACNTRVKDFTSILILHYLLQKIKGLPKLSGDWLTFRELSGVEGYFDAYHKRAIEPIIRKYGKSPEAIKTVLQRLPAKEFSGGDFGIVVQAFEGVPVLVKLWKADEEFGPDANMYFDSSITAIFCTEDIVVLAGIIAGSL
ncbi:MAG: DUF3786 domain-containing protein [Candidatus Omnitrophota bacterium]|nr:DUF3786 domain-containing protein [Candidatus Omnitrophota bacterium]